MSSFLDSVIAVVGKGKGKGKRSGKSRSLAAFGPCVYSGCETERESSSLVTQCLVSPVPVLAWRNFSCELMR